MWIQASLILNMVIQLPQNHLLKKKLSNLQCIGFTPCLKSVFHYMLFYYLTLYSILLDCLSNLTVVPQYFDYFGFIKALKLGNVGTSTLLNQCAIGNKYLK